MNSILEEKLKELIDTARQQGSGAVFAVAHMLHDSCVGGTHIQFARHCSQFTQIQMGGLNVQQSDPSSGDIDEFPKELWPSDYQN